MLPHNNVFGPITASLGIYHREALGCGSPYLVLVMKWMTLFLKNKVEKNEIKKIKIKFFKF